MIREGDIIHTLRLWEGPISRGSRRRLSPGLSAGRSQLFTRAGWFLARRLPSSGAVMADVGAEGVGMAVIGARWRPVINHPQERRFG